MTEDEFFAVVEQSEPWTEALASEFGKAITMNCIKAAFKEVLTIANELTTVVGNSGDFTTEDGRLKAIKQQAEALGLRRSLAVLFEMAQLSEETEDV